MWEMEGEGKAMMKKEAKETTTKKANCCASPGIYKELQILSVKATLPTHCDGNAGISLLLDELFSQVKRFVKDFFLSYSSSAQKFCVHAGEDVLLEKCLFPERCKRCTFAWLWNHISHLETGRGFVLCNNLLSLGSWQEFECSSKSSSKNQYVPNTVKALKMQWSLSTIKKRMRSQFDGKTKCSSDSTLRKFDPDTHQEHNRAASEGHLRK